MRKQHSSRLAVIVVLTLAIALAGVTVVWATQAGAEATTLTVTSTDDSGPGTLRQALQDAANGDTILFDPAVFPPASPATIWLYSALPDLWQGNLTIDASNAGVILDGSNIPSGNGLTLSHSDGNIIRGLQIVHFPDTGIWTDDSDYNVIGGDHEIGSGPMGQGNLVSGNGWNGIYLHGDGSYNVISGNYIGVDLAGESAVPNDYTGVLLMGSPGPHDNTIGGLTPTTRNVISGNGEQGLNLGDGANHNTIAGNLIGTNAAGTAAIGNGKGGVYLRTARYNVVGGTNATPGGACTGACNLISSNGIDGVNVYGSGSDHNTITGNYIGLDAAGTSSLGNTYEGVTIENGGRYNIVGGSTPGERNVISGNGNNGILMHTDVMSNTVIGNYIGTDASGTNALGNSSNGVLLSNGAAHNIIGGLGIAERNMISYNTGGGVSISGTEADSNLVQNNWIGVDADGTQGLDPRDLVVADDGTLFLADWGRGVFKSTDSAASWEPASGGLTTLEIEMLAVAPDFSSSQRAWAWGDGELFVTGDAGGSWSALGSPLPATPSDLQVSPDYAADHTLLAAVMGYGLYKSADGGATWSQVLATGYVYSLAFSPNFAADHLALCGALSAVLRSVDGGNTWTFNSDGLPQNGVPAIAIAPDGLTALLVVDSCYGDRVYRSADGGETWTASGAGVEDCGPEWEIAISPDFAADGVVLLKEDPVWRSTDGGHTWNWSGSGVFGSRGRALAFSPDYAGDQTAYAVSWAGIFQTIDGGQQWGWAAANLADRGNGGTGVQVCCGAGANQVLGNVIARNGGEGIRIADPEAAGTLVDGNLVGLAPDGVSRAANGGTNSIDSPYVSVTDNTIAAGSTGLRSGQAAHHLTISNNRIGTDLSGTLAIGNGYEGMLLESSWDVVRDNLVSGNWGQGIYATENVSHSLFAGNLIGVDATGSQALGNGRGAPGPSLLGEPEAKGHLLAAAGGMGNDNTGLDIHGSYNVVGGTSPADRNVLSGNSRYGLVLEGTAQYNTIVGNYVGTDITGMAAIPNGWIGVLVFSNYNVIGGNSPQERNLLSGNVADGIYLAGSSYTTVSGNYIGADASGEPALANGYYGIIIRDGSHNLVGGTNPSAGGGCSGACNLIAGSSFNGILLWGWSSTPLFNTLSQNSIYDNGELGIDLQDGANTELPPPVIEAFDLEAGTASGTACANCTVEVFSDEHGEGRWYEGSATADAAGDWSFAKGSALIGPAVTATATDTAGNTSEFGQDWPAEPPPAPVIAAPVCGVTNQSWPHFAGFSQVGSTVTVGAGGLELGEATADDEDRWELTSWEYLPDAGYTVTATATTAWGTSPEAELSLAVDSALCYDPVGVTFAQAGVIEHPRDTAGCADPSQVLAVDLWPSQPVTVSVPVADPAATVYLEVNSVQHDLTDPDGDGLFTGSFVPPDQGSLVMLLVVDCGAGLQTMQIGSTIDPDGYVFDAELTYGGGITITVEGAMVTLWVSDTVRSKWVQWDAALYGQLNPQMTGEDGYFAFFTPPGTYKLIVDARSQGFALYESPPLTVVDNPIRYNVPLWREKERIYLPMVVRNCP